MPTLFQIADEIAALHDLLTETGGELPSAEAEAAIDQWLAETEQALEKKIDGYCGLIREYEARSDARQVEAARLMSLAATDTNNVRRLKDRLKLFFELHGIKKLETPRFRVTIQANGGKAPLIVPEQWERDPASSPEQFHRHRIELDKEAIREALEAGEDVDDCLVGPKGNHLRIR